MRAGAAADRSPPDGWPAPATIPPDFFRRTDRAADHRDIPPSATAAPEIIVRLATPSPRGSSRGVSLSIIIVSRLQASHGRRPFGISKFENAGPDCALRPMVAST
jgi:hypothetical protein